MELLNRDGELTFVVKGVQAPKDPLSVEQKERLLKWAEALESDKYQQGRGCLRQHSAKDGNTIYNGFCCLGVACEISKLGEWVSENDELEDKIVYTTTVFTDEPGGCTTYDVLHLPGLVKEWYGLRGIYGFASSLISVSSGEDSSLNLAQLNDKGRIPFKELAKLIRAYAEGGYTAPPSE